MSWLIGPIMVIFVISALFLILLVLVQTSRGTGITGMFGGMGESSAFGTKTGSLMGRLTAIAAAVFLAMALAYGLITMTPDKLKKPAEQETPPAGNSLPDNPGAPGS